MNQVADALMGLLGNKSDEEVATLLATAKAVRDKRAELAVLEAQLRQMTATLAPSQPGRKPRGPNLTPGSPAVEHTGPTQPERVISALTDASPLSAQALCARTGIPYGSMFSVLSALKKENKIRPAETGGYELCG